jgi:hypothetical protein
MISDIPKVVSRSKGEIIVLRPQERAPGTLTEPRSLRVRRLRCCKVANICWSRYAQSYKVTGISAIVHG